MASGEQLAAAEDWFGFAELSEEPSKPKAANIQLTTCQHSSVVDQKSLKQDKIQIQSDKTDERTDQNEVLVPIISTKSGIKKYKVLARQKVEDDDDVATDDEKDRDSEEESPPITALKYVGNNTWRGTYNRFDKKFIPTSSVRYCSDSGKVEITTEKIDKTKYVKETVNSKSKPHDNATVVNKNPRKHKGDGERAPSKKKKKKSVSEKEKTNDEKGCDISVQENKDCMNKPEDIKIPVDNTEELKEAGEPDLIRNKPQVENTSCDKVDDITCSAVEQTQEGTETVINECEQSQNSIDCDVGQIEASMSPCAVKLKKDPSIDGLHALLDNGIARNKCEKNSPFHQTNATVEEEKEQIGVTVVLDDDTVMPRRHSADDKYTTDDIVQRQTSMDESKCKMISMVFNPDLVELRKSGRLKSAKCSSRYRGDYGIRAETYNRMVHCRGRDSAEEASAYSNLEGSMCNEPCKRCETQAMDTTDNSVDNKRKLHISKESSVLRKKLKVSHTVMRRRKLLKQVRKSNYSSRVDNTNQEGYVDNSGNIGQTSTGTDIVVDLKTCHEELLNDGNIAAVDSSKDQVNGHDELNKTDRHNCNTSPSKVLSCENCTCYQKVEVQAQNFESTVSQSNDTSVIKYNCDGCSENLKAQTCLELGAHSEEKQICDTQETVPYKSERKHVCDKISFESVCHTECAIFSESETCHESQTLVQMETDCDSSTLSEQFCLKTLQHSDYVHSVGKSVNKKQNQISERKIMQSESEKANINSADLSPESSPNKQEPGTILEDLRMKLFQRAGASVKKSEKPKQFESKLISSKRKCSKGNANTSHVTEVDLDTINKDNRSGKSTPKSDSHVTSADSGKEILEEVARTLGIFQQAKRKAAETKSEKTAKPKRQKFEQKTFLLRSMLKEKSKACNQDETDNQISNCLAESSNGESSLDLNSLQAAVITEEETTKIIESAVKSGIGLGTETTLTEENTLKDSESQRTPVNDTEIDAFTKNDTHSKVPKCTKPKSIKCQACSHTFKSKELLRKHYPCRIRQTRTWSQNILRPNRPFKRNEKKEEKFRCKLPKSIKSDGKTRRQLLVPRKTKFRRVKGKRRRRLYQLLQELKEKRKIIQWPHLSVSYDKLSYKEQCMYKLGLSCKGRSDVGLDNYSQEEVLLFQAQKVRQEEVDTEIFEHLPTDQEIEDGFVDNNIESSMEVYSAWQNKDDKITDRLNSGAQTNESKQKEEPQSSTDLEQSMTDEVSSHLDSSYNEPSLCDYAHKMENAFPLSEEVVNEIENEAHQSAYQLDDFSNNGVALNVTNEKIQHIEKDKVENDSSCVLETNSVCLPELNGTGLVEAQEQKITSVLPEPDTKETEATLSSLSTPEHNENIIDVNVEETPNSTNEVIKTSDMESIADDSSFLIKQTSIGETQSKTEAHVEVANFIDCIVSEVVHLVETCKKEQKGSHNDTNLDTSGENSHDYEMESNADMNSQSPDKEYAASMDERGNDNLESEQENYIDNRERNIRSDAFKEASLELGADFQHYEDTLHLSEQNPEKASTCSDSLIKPSIECQNNMSDIEITCKKALNESLETYDLGSDKHTDIACGQDECSFESKGMEKIEVSKSKTTEERLDDDSTETCSDKPEEAIASKGDGLFIDEHRDYNQEEIHSAINHIHEDNPSTVFLPDEEKSYLHCSDDWRIEINESYSEDELEIQQAEQITMPCFPQDQDDQRISLSAQDELSQDSESALEYVPRVLDNSTKVLEVADEELTDTFDKEEKEEESFRSSPVTSPQSPCEFETSQPGSIEESDASVIELKSSSVENSVHVNEADTNMIICYEQNGVIISENLLTGDKSVVPRCKNTKFTETDESEYVTSSKVDKENIALCDTDTAISAEAFVDSFPEKYSDESIDEESISPPQNKNDETNVDTCESDTNDELYGSIPIVKETKTSVIHHEENGVVMCEDLLTGEKMVVRAEDEQTCSKDESIPSLVESQSIDSIESYDNTTDVLDICKSNLSRENMVNGIHSNYPSRDLHCSSEQLRENLSELGIIEDSMDRKYQAKVIPEPTDLPLYGKETLKEFKQDHDVVISGSESLKNNTYNADVLENMNDTEDEVKAILRENTEIYNVIFTSNPTKENRSDLNNSPYSISTEDSYLGENAVTELNQHSDINNLADPAIIDDINVDVDTKTCDSIKIDNHASDKMKQGVRKFSVECNIQSSEVEEMRSSLDASFENEQKDISVFDISASDDLRSVQSDGSASGSFGIDACQEIDDDDIHSPSTLDIEAPPILEKVVEMYYPEDIPDETFSEDSQLSSGEPPTLIPEEESAPEKTPSIGKITESVIERVQTEIPVYCFKNDTKKQRPERHFLDVFGDVCQNKEALNIANDNDTLCFDKPVDDFIGRHFSDVIDNSVKNSRKLQSNLPINCSESGERTVTIAKLREILKPAHGNEGYLTTETLFKLRSDIVHLLKNVKVPVKKDPAWLKRDFLKAYSKRKQNSCKPKSNNNISEKYRLNDSDELFSDEREHSDGNEEFADDESDLSDWEEDNLKDDGRHSLDNPDRYSKGNDGNEKLTKGGITDSILQMLTSIEDKGNVAVNLSNLLDVLAKNLGFSSNSGDSTIHRLNENNSDSDSNYSCTATDVALRENVNIKGQGQQETFSWLLEGDEPPSIDDIPLPEDDHITTQEEAAPANTSSRIVDTEPVYDTLSSSDIVEKHYTMNCRNSLSPVTKNSLNDDDDDEKAIATESIIEVRQNTCVKQDIQKHINADESISETCDANITEEKVTFTDADFVKETREPMISKDAILPSQVKSEGSDACDIDIDSSVIDDSSNKKKVKGSSVSCLFKSITELNTIETDDDFDIDSTFDPVSMSRQMCELKAFTENVSDTEVRSEISSISDNEELLEDNSEVEMFNTAKTFFGIESSNKNQTSSPKPHVAEFCEEGIDFHRTEILNDMGESKIEPSNSSSDQNEIMDGTVSVFQDESTSESIHDKSKPDCSVFSEVKHTTKPAEMGNDGNVKSDEDTSKDMRSLPQRMTIVEVITADEDDIIITKTDETSDEEEIIENKSNDFRKAQDEMDENFSRALTDIGILNESMDNDVEPGENSDSVSSKEAICVEDQGKAVCNEKEEHVPAEKISNSAIFTCNDSVHKRLNECITPEVDMSLELFGLSKSYDRMRYESSNKNKGKDNDAVTIEKVCTCDNAETINKCGDLENKTQVLEDGAENKPKDDINVKASPMTVGSIKSASEVNLSIEIRDKDTKDNYTYSNTLEKEPVEYFPNSEDVTTVEEAFNQDDNSLEIKQIIENKELEKEAAKVDSSKLVTPADNKTSNDDIYSNKPEKATSKKTETTESCMLNSLNTSLVCKSEKTYESRGFVTEDNLQILRKQTVGDKALQSVNAYVSVAVEQVFSVRTDRNISLVDAQYDSESEVSDRETIVSSDADSEDDCSTTEKSSSSTLNTEKTSTKLTENDLRNHCADTSDLKCVVEQHSAPFEENKLKNAQEMDRSFPPEDSEKENVYINSSESHDHISQSKIELHDCQEIDDDDIYFVEEHKEESLDAKPVDQSSVKVNEQIDESISTLRDICPEGVRDPYSSIEGKLDDEDSNHTVDYNDPHTFHETLTAKEMNGVLQDHIDKDTNSCSLSLMQSEKTDDHSEKENYPGQEIHDSLEDTYPDFKNTFFETIAEKVKRMQKERLLNQSHSISKRIAPVKKQRPAVKEISVFRRTMLDKRLRQNSLSYANIKCPSRKKRERCSSLPKGLKIAPILRNLSLDVKPCSVKLTKLSQSTIQKYIHPPRIERPPIKLKIKLSDIIMPCSPYSPYTYSSTEDETIDEMMDDSDKSPMPSTVSEHQSICSDAEEDIQEPPAVEMDNKYRSKSVDNVVQRLKPLRIYLTDVMRMPKSKSFDFSQDLHSQHVEAQKQPKCSDNVSIARQICRTNLQLSESDSDSDDDLREGPPSVLGKNDIAGVHKNTDEDKLAGTDASSHASWTDIKFQNTETKAYSTDKTMNLIDALCEYEQTTLFEDEQPSAASDNRNGEGMFGALNQHVENLLDSDLDKSGTITETVQSLSSPSEGANKESRQIETEEAAMRIQNEIFEEKTKGSGGECMPDVYNYAEEVSNDVEICEAVHNLETVELGEVTATSDMTIVDYKNIQELERTPSYVKADYTTGKNVLGDNMSVYTSEEPGALSTRQSDQDIPNKYLYGISEESQSSAELIEEQVIEETVAEMTVEDEFVSITSYESEPAPTAQVTSFSHIMQSAEDEDL